MPSAFYSNGKLLISGEYVVLDGAKAWAIPTKFGQHLRVSQNDSGLLSWKSIDDKGLLWFEAIYKQDKLIEVSASDSKISKTLIDILSEARKMNPAFLMDSDGSDIETKLTFPKDWVIIKQISVLILRILSITMLVRPLLLNIRYIRHCQERK
jgi:mevalonate kinase